MSVSYFATLQLQQEALSLTCLILFPPSSQTRRDVSSAAIRSCQQISLSLTNENCVFVTSEAPLRWAVWTGLFCRTVGLNDVIVLLSVSFASSRLSRELIPSTPTSPSWSDEPSDWGGTLRRSSALPPRQRTLLQCDVHFSTWFWHFVVCFLSLHLKFKRLTQLFSSFVVKLAFVLSILPLPYWPVCTFHTEGWKDSSCVPKLLLCCHADTRCRLQLLGYRRCRGEVRPC